MIKFADTLDETKHKTIYKIMQQHIDSYDFTGKRAIVRVDFSGTLKSTRTMARGFQRSAERKLRNHR